LLAADVVGHNTADQAANAPAKEGDGEHRTNISRDLGESGRIDERPHGRSGRQNQSVGLKAVEEPAQIGRQ
jgi:hypothetical protein